MNIGIDVDGVILDSESWFRTYAEIYDIETIGRGVVEPNATKAQVRMGWSEEEFDVYKNKYMKDIMKYAPLMSAAKEVIDRLKSMGHRLVLITARGCCTSFGVELAEKMLKDNNIHMDKKCFNSVDKLIPCRDEKIDYMIDDAYENVLHLSENGIKCLYFRAYGSKDIDNDNVISVRNWGEILRFFLEIEKNK